MANNWIAINCDIRYDRYILNIAGALNRDEAEIVGYLTELLCAVARQGEDINAIGEQTDRAIEMLARWRGRRGRFARALRESQVLTHGAFAASVRRTERIKREWAHSSQRATARRLHGATVMDRDGRKCRRCGSTRRLQIDHIKPLSRGGTNDASNLQVLCRDCNISKGARDE